MNAITDDQQIIEPTPIPTNPYAGPEQEIEQNAKMTDDEILNYTKGVRVSIVKDLTRTGTVPADNANKALLMTALKDLDQQAINKKRLVIEEKGADNSSLIVATLLRQVDKKSVFRQVPGEAGSKVIDVTAMVLPDDIETPKALPGEGDVNPPQMDYESFMKANGKDPAALGAAAANTPHPEAEGAEVISPTEVDEDY